jgi:spoIIIJ-associated protein
VAEDDAEFEVLEEPRVGLFGRMRGEARVRARVRPTRPRPKVERRDRRRRRPERERTNSGAPAKAAADAPEEGTPTKPANGGRRRRAEEPTEGDMTNDATVEDQARIIQGFLEGLVGAFGLTATMAEERIDDDTIELQVNGDDLGLLIGPKGQTLQAIQELSRTVVQRQATGTHYGRVRLDVAGYRQRRREALERFARQVAEDVVRTGVPRALEPMHPADRKVVHDTVNGLDGVSTTSEGEEPRRRVVIAPAS